jgi:hypothetical protein
MASILSLPVLKTAIDSADFTLTVRPYIAQLLDLPKQLSVIASSTSKIDDLGALYLNTNPLVTAFAFSLLLAPIFLVISEINKNYSQVDRAWSILPSIYIAHYTAWAHKNGLPTQRMDNILVFSLIWSTRLTFNYWRKGGYSVGSEDYRWLIVKSKVGPVVMFLFNVTFIALIQSVCIPCLSTLPNVTNTQKGSLVYHHYTCIHPDACVTPGTREDGSSRHRLRPRSDWSCACRILRGSTTVGYDLALVN